MRRLVLTKPITITGRDYWGRGAEVTLEPTNTCGWYWHVQGEDIPLTPKLVQHAFRRIMLKHGADELHVFEHLGPLRFAGVDGIRISAKTKWLPYDGSANIFWTAIRRHLHEDGELRPMQNQLCVSRDSSKGMDRHIEIETDTSDSLLVVVRIDYPEWGAYTLERRLPNDRLTTAFAAKPLAPFAWAQPIAYVASKCGWPHYRSMIWPRGLRSTGILHQVTLHRMLDFLGAMSVIPRAGECLTGRLLSDCANHEADVEFLHAI